MRLKETTQAVARRLTSSPTNKPSTMPIATKPPTTVPTDTPTQAPTKVPTDSPTQAPTKVPTDSPTQAPTKVPTDTPTQAPTTNVKEQALQTQQQKVEKPKGQPQHQREDQDQEAALTKPFAPGASAVQVADTAVTVSKGTQEAAGAIQLVAPAKLKTSAKSWLLHPNAVNHKENLSLFDTALTALHCEMKDCYSTTSAVHHCNKRVLFESALKIADEAFKAHDMEAAVAAYLLAFEPAGNPLALRNLNFSALKPHN